MIKAAQRTIERLSYRTASSSERDKDLTSGIHHRELNYFVRRTLNPLTTVRGSVSRDWIRELNYLVRRTLNPLTTVRGSVSRELNYFVRRTLNPLTNVRGSVSWGWVRELTY